jgi:haloacetate dehalogenase
MAGDLFPGFRTERLPGQGALIHARIGGGGPPLLLLHGYPQTHACWHRVAPDLARHFTVVAADLRGYGRSSCPPTDSEHRPYSKRVMAADMVAAMAALGFHRFHVMGHNRGARVSYRLALDHPDRVARLVLLDIVATPDQWEAREQAIRLRMFHWAFLAQPAPIPESLIASNPDDWLETRFRRGTKARALSAIDGSALDDYKTFFRDPDRLHATCEDYRAGARIDLADDLTDRESGRRIAPPVLVLWAMHGPLAEMADVLGQWRPWCRSLAGEAIDSGHFIAEEVPEALLARARPFFLGETERPA